MRAPFPWFGGKSRVASIVWDALGADVTNYVEPFAGSLAVLLSRPGGAGPVETVNDADGFISNFWRAIAFSPEETAQWADWPVNENDLHARHAWLLSQSADLAARLEGDPEFHDPKVAGWWVWGICSWIGSGWCSGNGPWRVVDGKLENLGNQGRGINRQLPHLGDQGQGINRKRPHLGDQGQGVLELFERLAARLRRVRVCCGEWSRVCGPSVTHKHGLTGVFLDPPYGDAAKRTPGLYKEDSLDVAALARAWAIENGSNPLLRIAFCGYEGEHEFPPEWQAFSWKSAGGFGSQGENGIGRLNAHRERIWFSPHCLAGEQLSLFDEVLA